MCASLCTNPSSHACGKCSQPKMSQQQGRMDAHSFECRAVLWCISLREVVITFDGFAQIASVILREGFFFFYQNKDFAEVHNFIFVDNSATISVGNTRFEMPRLWNKATVYTNRDLCAHLLPQLFLLWDHLACSNNAYSATHKSLIFTEYTSVENYPDIFLPLFFKGRMEWRDFTHFYVGKCHTAKCYFISNKYFACFFVV